MLLGSIFLQSPSSSGEIRFRASEFVHWECGLERRIGAVDRSGRGFCRIRHQSSIAVEVFQRRDARELAFRRQLVVSASGKRSESVRRLCRVDDAGGGKKFLRKSGESGFQSKDRGTSAQEVDGVWQVRSEGWGYQYRDGKIVEAITPEGERLIWCYQDGFLKGIKSSGASPEAFGGTGAVRSVAIHGRHGGRPSSNKAEASFGVSDPMGINAASLSLPTFPE